MAKYEFNKIWLHAHINDPYVKLAQKEVREGKVEKLPLPAAD